MSASFLMVEAGVRYWEDAEVNGISDENGDLIPFRDGDLWCPVIDLETGLIIGWPIGTTASIHYKICDAGAYWLADSEHKKIYQWNGHYVPNSFLCFGENGYGDYIVFDVNPDGGIKGWKTPYIDREQWKVL